jgi:hypothetical protein
MLQDKIDVTAFLTWLVESYPESVAILKSDLEIFNKFRVLSSELKQIAKLLITVIVRRFGMDLCVWPPKQSPYGERKKWMRLLRSHTQGPTLWLAMTEKK